MVQVKEYYLPPTPLIPNSPYPLLHYPAFLSAGSDSIATKFYDLLSTNGWQAQWIFRYGQTQRSHYHSTVHECMVVLTGSATLRFGVADTTDDMHENTYSKGREEGGVEVQAQAGDVFIIPAGVAHKTFDAKPAAEFKLLTPGDGHGLAGDAREKLEEVELEGFTMLGAYPKDGGKWDFAEGGEGSEMYARPSTVLPPALDPVLGASRSGLCTLWAQS